MSRTLTRFSRFRMQWIWQRNRFHRGWELGTVGQSPRKQKTQNASNVFEVCSQIQLTMKLRLFIFFSSFLLFFGKTPEKWLNFNFFPLATCHYWNFLLCNSISHPTKWEDETISSHIEKPHRIGIGKKIDDIQMTMNMMREEVEHFMWSTMIEQRWQSRVSENYTIISFSQRLKNYNLSFLHHLIIFSPSVYKVLRYKKKLARLPIIFLHSSLMLLKERLEYSGSILITILDESLQSF